MNKTLLKKIAAWIGFALLCILFLRAGVGKFLFSAWQKKFAAWGYPDGFHLVIGAVETLAAIALLIPKLRGYASISLLVVMLGALTTHIIHAETPNIIVTSIYSVIFGILTYVHRAQFLKKKGAHIIPDYANKNV
jgi:putative oxidoreductase